MSIFDNINEDVNKFFKETTNFINKQKECKMDKDIEDLTKILEEEKITNDSLRSQINGLRKVLDNRLEIIKKAINVIKIYANKDNWRVHEDCEDCHKSDYDIEFCGIDGKSDDEENGYDIAQRALKDIERMWGNE